MFTFFYRYETGTSLLRKLTFMPVARETTDSVAGRRFEDLPVGILIGFPKPSEGMKQKQAVFLRGQPARSFSALFNCAPAERSPVLIGFEGGAYLL